MIAIARRVRRGFDEHPSWSFVVVALALGFGTVLGTSVGALPLAPSGVWRALTNASDPMHDLLWAVRVPRLLVGVLVGATLSVAGVILQTVVRNPLADPSLIGVSAGAGVAGLLVIVLAPSWSAWLPAAAFSGAALATAVILALAWRRDRAAGPLRIILSGVAVQAILFAVIGLVTFTYADRAPSFAAFTVGSLAGAGWHDVSLAAPGAALGLVLSLVALPWLDLLLLDDDSAAGVGLPVHRVRLGVSCVACVLAATAVSVAGLVGFVGLVVPNAMRLVVGPRHVRLVPLSALGGAALVVFADAAARTIVAPLELPVGSLLALVGGPYFVFLLWRRVP